MPENPFESSMASPTQSTSLAWYWNRLRCMSLAEIWYRTHRGLAARAQRVSGSGHASVPKATLDAGGAAWATADVGVGAGAYVDEAERLMAGRMRVFDLLIDDSGSVPTW